MSPKKYFPNFFIIFGLYSPPLLKQNSMHVAESQNLFSEALENEQARSKRSKLEKRSTMHWENRFPFRPLDDICLLV